MHSAEERVAAGKTQIVDGLDLAMKTGGIIIAILGLVLFFWHLVRVWINANYEGYASHEVMAMNALILVVLGTTFYFWGRRRVNRNPKSEPGELQPGARGQGALEKPDREA